MNRVEENKIIVDFITQTAKAMPTGNIERIIGFHLGTIATILADISKSLAVIADKGANE